MHNMENNTFSIYNYTWTITPNSQIKANPKKSSHFMEENILFYYLMSDFQEIKWVHII